MFSSEINSDSAIRTATSTVTLDKKSAAAAVRRAKQPIIYDIFEKAIAYTDDPFWQLELSNAARNKFRKYFYCQDGSIYWNKNGKQRHSLVPPVPSEAARLFIEFHQNNARLISDKDMRFAEASADFSTDTYTPPVRTWTKIPRKLRISMLKSYTFKCRVFLNLTREEALDLEFIILTGFNNNIICSSNIVFDGFEIIKINDVHMNPETRKFYITPRLLEQALEKSRKDEAAGYSFRKIDLSQYPDPIYLPKGVPLSEEWHTYIQKYKVAPSPHKGLESIPQFDFSIQNVQPSVNISNDDIDLDLIT